MDRLSRTAAVLNAFDQLEQEGRPMVELSEISKIVMPQDRLFMLGQRALKLVGLQRRPPEEVYQEKLHEVIVPLALASIVHVRQLPSEQGESDKAYFQRMGSLSLEPR
jgi:hypothetical protein